MRLGKTEVNCEKCGGKGKHLLPAALQETLDAVHYLQPCTAPQVFEHLNLTYCGVTAINQRLSDLMKMGLVERERIGTAYQYRIVKKGNR